eukprot:51136-Rhodomonas_salina.1
MTTRAIKSGSFFRPSPSRNNPLRIIQASVRFGAPDERDNACCASVEEARLLIRESHGDRMLPAHRKTMGWRVDNPQVSVEAVPWSAAKSAQVLAGSAR